MSLYYRGIEIREIDDALYAAWVAAGNPKAGDWQPLPAQPAHDPQTHSIAWDGAQWVVSALPPPPVPESVPAHHLRRALRELGMLAAVNAYMAALGDDDEMRESWEYAPRDIDGQVLPRNLANETAAFQNFAAGIYNGTKANIRAWEKSELDKASVVADMD